MIGEEEGWIRRRCCLTSGAGHPKEKRKRARWATGGRAADKSRITPLEPIAVAAAVAAVSVIDMC